MPISHKFTVKQSKNAATTHEITISVPAFSEATEKQRKTLYAEGIDSAVIKVQGGLRRALEKGVRGDALRARAQKHFDAILAGGRVVDVPTITLKASEGFTAEQVDGLNKSKAGAAVFVFVDDTPKQSK